MISNLIKRENLDTDCTERTACEGEGRDRGDDSISQGMPEIVSNSPESRREAWDRFLTHGPQKKQILLTH